MPLFAPGLLLGLAALPFAAASPGPSPASSFPLPETTIAQTEAALQAGTVTCHEIVQGYLDRIAAFDQPTHLNTVVTLNPMALADADRLDAELRQTHKLRPLHCIALAVKDNYDTAGLQTTGGSLAMKGVVPKDDAFMVRKLREAGAVVLFKSNMAVARPPTTTLWAFAPRSASSAATASCPCS